MGFFFFAYMSHSSMCLVKSVNRELLGYFDTCLVWEWQRLVSQLNSQSFGVEILNPLGHSFTAFDTVYVKMKIITR